MKTTNLISLLGVGLLGALVGCGQDDSSASADVSAIVAAPSPAPAPASPAASPSSATTANLSATVTKKTLTLGGSSGQCKVNVDYPEVTTPDPAVTAAIAKLLPPPTVADLCAKVDPSNPGQTVETDGSFTVQANSYGILSITSHSEVTLTPSAHPEATFTSHNFDLTTGKELGLTDVLTTASVDVVKTACIAALQKADSKVFDLQTATQNCTAATTGATAPGAAFFEIEDAGFHLMLDLPFAVFEAGEDGALVLWKDLPGVTPGLVADFVRAHAS